METRVTWATGEKLDADDLNHTIDYLEQQDIRYAASANGNDNYEITLDPVTDTLQAGQLFMFGADVDNDGACTFEVNKTGQKAIVDDSGNALRAKMIQANDTVIVKYSATLDKYVLISPKRSTKSSGAVACSVSGSGTQQIAHGLGAVPKFIKITALYRISSGLNADSESIGTYDGTDVALIRKYYDDPTYGAAIGTANIVHIEAAAGEPYATVTMDETNITLTWTGGDTNVKMLWEAEL